MFSHTGFTFRYQSVFLVPHISHLGAIIDEKGLRPDPKKTEAFRNLPAPSNKTTLQSFLAMVNNNNNFVPSMQPLRVSLNNLLKGDIKWFWFPQDATRNKKFMSGPALIHYNPQLPAIAATDANKYGIDAVLLHKFPDGNQVAGHVSLILTRAEKKYRNRKTIRVKFCC